MKNVVIMMIKGSLSILPYKLLLNYMEKNARRVDYDFF